MKPIEFATKMGVSKQAISQACKAGRLKAALRRNKRGAVIDIDPALGSLEWTTNLPRLPPTPEALAGVDRASGENRERAEEAATVAPEIRLAGFDALERPRSAFVAVLFPLDRFLVGAAAALRELGEEAAPDSLRRFLESVPLSTWWVAVSAALDAALDGGEIAARLPAMWEAEGREAVLEARKGT